MGVTRPPHSPPCASSRIRVNRTPPCESHRAGFSVIVITSDGITGIELGFWENEIWAQADDPLDLILLDIMMPGLSGYEVCEQLHADPRTHDIPIIFLSALNQTEDKVKAFTSGGVDYITKPFQIEEVLARVRTHLRLYALQEQLAKRVRELEEAMAQIKTLRGLLPICARCKKVRDDQGYWQDVELYIRDHTDIDISHGICPDCFRELYPDYADIVDDSGDA